ncbi:MAG TPA: amidohydrolase family protein, partial [Acidimicrobiales bacterium]|nr:amidohydrolase family protein [Acidimicrobiales bacterium]
TDVPARLFGLRDRGRLAEGCYGDLVVFDPETIDSEPARRAWDLPGDSMRMTAGALGIKRVLVNGREAIVDGEPTGILAGTVLRSGRDTETVTTH